MDAFYYIIMFVELLLWSSWKFISYFEFEGRNWYILYSWASSLDLPTIEDQITTRCHETSGTK